MKTTKQTIHEITLSEICSILAGHFSDSNSTHIDFHIDEKCNEPMLEGATVTVVESIEEKKP